MAHARNPAITEVADAPGGVECAIEFSPRAKAHAAPYVHECAGATRDEEEAAIAKAGFQSTITHVYIVVLCAPARPSQHLDP
eukprot:4124188-Prymnesium_polylepis.2